MALQMRPLCYFAFALLCGLSLLSPGLSLQCDDTQYEWPVQEPKYCCNKCRPGEYMEGRSDQCKIKCKPCPDEMYKDVYTVALTCKFCDSCKRDNMEYESPCNATHNAVCRCKAGYECKDQPCKECVPIAITTPHPTPQPVSMESVRSHAQENTTPLLGDTVWFLVVIVILAAVIAVIVLTKIKPFLRWIKSQNGFIFSETCEAVPTSEDTEVSQPVQDTCGKCYQPIV